MFLRLLQIQYGYNRDIIFRIMNMLKNNQKMMNKKDFMSKNK